MNEAVVVTGAAGGIGRACVSRLTALGFTVVVGVRSDSQAASFDPPVRCLRLDLSQPEDIARAAEAVRSLRLSLRALVNNAGASRAGALEDLPLEATRGLIAARARMARRTGALPDRVAKVIARAVTDPRPRSRYFVGLDSRGAFLLGRIAPAGIRGLVYRHLLGFR
jgi:NAD(P)-dependent dehydrogenase (short-subunit alcohol dehydrogenase family)